MSGTGEHYDEGIIRFLGELWGEGFLSPGGPAEIARVLEGLDLGGKRVLDIGCGAGGGAITLVRDLGAGHVTGIDVEETSCAAARRLVAQSGLSGQVDIFRVDPGPWPFADGTFDVVFSKDSIIHIPDKVWLAAEAFRVLRPGGWFAASDWLISHDGDPSPEMARYIEFEDLDFAMASPDSYRRALEAAGFEQVSLVSRNAWYRDQAEAELARMQGRERARFEEILGAEAVADQIATWTAMVPVLRSGEHCPHHFRGRKPLA